MIDNLTSILSDSAPGDAEAVPPPTLTPHVAIKRISVLVNPLSGSVGPKAIGELETLLADYDLEAKVVSLEGGSFDAQVDEAFAGEPDVIFVLAGDGTAGTVASRAGPKGPLVAPLPGGTMNMLPKALYDTADWKLALNKALQEGEVLPVAGGAPFRGRPFSVPPFWDRRRSGLRRGRPCEPARSRRRGSMVAAPCAAPFPGVCGIRWTGPSGARPRPWF